MPFHNERRKLIDNLNQSFSYRYQTCELKRTVVTQSEKSLEESYSMRAALPLLQIYHFLYINKLIHYRLSINSRE